MSIFIKNVDNKKEEERQRIQNKKIIIGIIVTIHIMLSILCLYLHFFKCKFEYKKDKRGYPICMKSVYKGRKFKPPQNASRLCRKIFKK